jgi:hypothetical protein
VTGALPGSTQKAPATWPGPGDAWGTCPNVLITNYKGDPTPFGAAFKAIPQALP